MKVIDVNFKEKKKNFTYDDAVDNQAAHELFNKLVDAIIWAKEIEPNKHKIHIFSMQLHNAFETLKRKIQ